MKISTSDAHNFHRDSIAFFYSAMSINRGFITQMWNSYLAFQTAL